MKIALLTKYGDLAASTRQRFEQYRPFLEEIGFELVPLPLLDNSYLQQLYETGHKPRGRIAACYVGRLRWLLSKPDVDLIWLHCELFPYLPGLVEKLSIWPGKPIVFDFDDAIFHNYDLHPRRQLRAFLGRKLYTTIGAAEMAFCGNNYLAEYARPLCTGTKIVPTVVDTEIFYPSPREQPEDCPLRVGWIGTPSTWNDYLRKKLPMLKEVAASVSGQIAVMGAHKNAEAHPLLDLVQWSEAGEVPFLQALDIGIMPLTDTPWARGKCGYKLIQYMACGLPVVASPVGVNRDIVEHGVNGFLAESDDDWRTAIETLLRDPDLRRRMGVAGRLKVEQNFSLHTWGPRVASMLKDTVRRNASA
ncbi:glycosyltransferase family 4 protein [Tateyamaria sp.]|uniref:glycosyltransferase family 4 protein n=1 Tax=Tateyamaria sp. TaxID=1929288 RepID=UPI0032A0892A